MSDCVIHPGRPGKRDGYVRVSRGLAHRVAWIDAHGPIPDGLVVMHSCDNRRCVNLEHLSLGTQADNIHDAQRKGRLVGNIKAAGELNPSARLTSVHVAVIRQRYQAGGWSQRQLAREFGVGQSQIHRIVNGESW